LFKKEKLKKIKIFIFKLDEYKFILRILKINRI